MFRTLVITALLTGSAVAQVTYNYGVGSIMPLTAGPCGQQVAIPRLDIWSEDPPPITVGSLVWIDTDYLLDPYFGGLSCIPPQDYFAAIYFDTVPTLWSVPQSMTGTVPAFVMTRGRFSRRFFQSDYISMRAGLIFPNNPALVGTTIYFQAAHLWVGNQGPQVMLSPGAILTL